MLKPVAPLQWSGVALLDWQHHARWPSLWSDEHMESSRCFLLTSVADRPRRSRMKKQQGHLQSDNDHTTIMGLLTCINILRQVVRTYPHPAGRTHANGR